MIHRVQLQNFQSWRELDIPLAPVTMFVGRGDVGKSAIVRAITYALLNQGGEAFIRDGASEASVGLAFDDVALLWTKPRGKGAVYQLMTDEGTKEFTKTGQSVPPAVQEATGVREIEIDRGSAITPQLTQQFDKPFIVEESGSRTARILGKLTRLDVLVQAQMYCRRDLNKNRNTADVAEERLTGYRQQLAEGPDIDDLHARWVEANDLQERAEDGAEAVEELGGLLKELPRLKRLADAPVRETAGLLDRAEKAVAQAQLVELALIALEQAANDLAAADIPLEHARQRAQELEDEYAGLCGEAGVCERCPWK